MAIYEVGLRTTGVGTGAAGFELRAVTRRLKLLELGLTLQAATASTFGLGRPANTGSVAGGTNNVPPPADAADAAALFQAVLAGWTTAPTAPTSFFRRIGFPATIGAGVVWSFRGIYVAPTHSLVLWNLAANGVSDVYAVVEEQ